MKKKLSTKLLIFLMSCCLFVPTLLLSTSTKAETLITINDNEKGWYGTDVYTASSVLQDSVRNYSTGFVLDPSDADNIGITWIQYINYAPVRTATDLYLYKDLPQPIDGGSFSFKINVANAYSHGSFGLEAIAYSANGTAYSLGKMYDDTGLSCNAWLAYSKPMPAGVAAVKMAIRMYVIPNPFQAPDYYPSIPNPSWPGVNYSLLDGIRFDNTAYAESIIKDDETTGWTGTTLRHTQNLDVSTYPFYSVEGSSSMVLRADIMAGANATSNIATIQKAISPVKNGSFAFKLYSPANTYAGDQRYFANVYATDVNNQSHLIGRFPQAGYLKFSGTGNCGQIFNGWNNFTGALPANLAISNIKIDLIDDSGVPVTDFPFYMDDVKFIGSSSVTLNNINDNEKGWYGTDVYTASSVLQDSVRNYSTGFVLDPSDTDNIGITWMQYINYAPVRTATDIYLYKDLPQPIDGGSFSFKINVANAYSHGSFGLEAIAYSANGTAYSLGKMYDDTGLSCGAWLGYSKPMPAGVAVVKMAIRMYVIPNPFQSPNYYPSIPNQSWPGVNYSLLDGIRFDSTVYAETIIRDDEATGWTGTTLRHTQNLDVSTYPFYSVEGNSSMVLRADIMAGANATSNIATIQKAISPVKNGSFAFKLYSPANTYAGDQRYFANVYATDVNNQSHLIGRFPQAGYLKFSGTGDCSQIFNGWNNFTGALPANLAISNIKIDLIDDSGVPVTDFAFYMDDVKFIGSEKVSIDYYVSNTAPGTTVSVLKSQKQSVLGALTVYDKNNVLASDSSLVTTGTKLKSALYNNDYYVVILGDIDKTGVVDISDLAMAKSHLLKATTLTGIELTAARISGKDNVTISDLLAIKKHILNIATINQNRYLGEISRNYFSSAVGMWYEVFFDSLDRNPSSYTQHWITESRSVPVEFGRYSSDDAVKITHDLLYLKSIGVDYLIIDDTNFHYVDNHNLAEHIETLFTIANNLGAQNVPKICFAGGRPLIAGDAACYAAFNMSALQYMNFEMNIFYDYYTRFPELYFSWKGKPLFVNFNYPQNFGWTDSRFTVRNASGITSDGLPVAGQYGLNSNGMYGWIFDYQYLQSEVYGVFPGFSRSHNNLDDSSLAPISRQNGLLFQNQFLSAIKRNPEMIVISSWNCHPEETGIEAVNLLETVAGRENEASNPFYYEQITEGYLSLKNGLVDNFYYKTESNSTVYQYKNNKLVVVSSAPQMAAVVVLPDDYILKMGVSVQ